MKENKLKQGLRYLTFALGCWILLSTTPAFAQQGAAPEDLQDPPQSAIEEQFEQEEADGTRQRKYLDLTMGIEHEDLLQDLPNNITFKGDYKKVVTLKYLKEAKALRLIPRDLGVATITVHNKDGKIVREFRINVKKSNLDKVAREIRSLIGEIEGIQIKILNNKVVIDGQVLLPKDLERIGTVIKQYPEIASTLVTLSPIAGNKIAQIMERDINNPEINVRYVNGSFFIEGVAGSKDEQDRAVIICKAYVPDLAISQAEGFTIRGIKREHCVPLLGIREQAEQPKKLIQLVVHYVELNKNYARNFNFQWTPGLQDSSSLAFKTGGREPGGVVSSITGVVDRLLPRLNAAKEHGHARILKSTSLLVEEGKKGEIKQVTKVPFKTIDNAGNATTSFEEAGIESSILPQLVGEKSDSISLDIIFSISELVGETSAGALISKNSINTKIVVRSSQSAAIGGLISNRKTADYNKLPPGGAENPLFRLQASKSFKNDQSQFIVFVTPIIKSSASAGSETLKKKYKLRD